MKLGKIDALIADMPLQFLQCRDWMHAWRPYTAVEDTKARTFRRELLCARCKTIRVEVLDRRGAVISKHYEYPDGYLTPAGTGRLTGTDRDKLRLRSVRAAMPTDTAED